MSQNGVMIILVKKLKNKPNAMEKGKAGRAFWKMAKQTSVNPRPTKTATKQARVVFQSP